MQGPKGDDHKDVIGHFLDNFISKPGLIDLLLHYKVSARDIQNFIIPSFDHLNHSNFEELLKRKVSVKDIYNYVRPLMGDDMKAIISFREVLDLIDKKQDPKIVHQIWIDISNKLDPEDWERDQHEERYKNSSRDWRYWGKRI